MYRILIVAAMGLGLGIGVTVTIFSTPDQLFAETNYQESSIEKPVAISSLSIPSIGYVADMVSTGSAKKSYNGNAIKQVGTAQLGEPGSLFITSAGYFSEMHNLSEVALGDEVRIIGTNNGVYRYTVVALRSAPYAEVTNLSQDITQEVVLFTKNSMFAADAHIVVATRVQ